MRGSSRRARPDRIRLSEKFLHPERVAFAALEEMLWQAQQAKWFRHYGDDPAFVAAWNALAQLLKGGGDA